MNRPYLFGLAEEPATTINPLESVLKSTGIEFFVFWTLVGMAVASWAVAILKALQISRMRDLLHQFEKDVFNVIDAKDLFAAAERRPGSPGARVVLALSKRGGSSKILESVAKRAVVVEEQRAARLMTTLASIASAAPFVGLLGTVYGIMDAFQRIGAQKSASLPVVAPGIGAALVTTLMGLVAAIPALVFYNLLSRKAEDLLAELESASEAWVSIVSESDARLSVDRTMPDPRQPRPADPRYPDPRYPSQERR